MDTVPLVAVDAPRPAPADLDVGLLAMFVGLSSAERTSAALADAGFGDLRFSHGFLIQHLVLTSRTVTDLAALQGVSVQAVSKVVKELVGMGYLVLEPDPNDGRARQVTLTPRARQAVDAGRVARTALDDDLRTALGARRHQQLHRSLVDALDALGGSEGVELRRIRLPS